MKKAKILSLLIMVLLVAVVFAAFAIPSFADTTITDPADGENFLTVIEGTGENEGKFKLEGIESGWIDEKYMDAETYPFVIATMPTKDKGTANAKYTLVTATYSSGSKIYADETKADQEYAKNDIRGFAKYLFGVTTGAVGTAKDTLKSANLYTWEKNDDVLTGKGQYNEDRLDAYIFFRADYSLKRLYNSGATTPAMTNETYGNLSQVQGNLYINMNNHTLTSGNTHTADYIFPMQCKAWADSSSGVPGAGAGDANAFPSYFTIKNGTISTYKAEVVRFCSQNPNNATYAGQMQYATKSFAFDNVNFKLEESAIATKWFGTAAVNSAVDVPVELTLDGCTYDINNAPDDFVILGADFELAKGYMKATVRVNGGTILADSINKTVALTNFGGENGVNNDSTMYFGTYNGEYIKISVPNNRYNLIGTGFEPTKLKLYDSSTNRLGFSCVSIKDGVKTYTLVPITADTFDVVANGKTIQSGVSIDYASKVEYPFIVKYNNSKANDYDMASFLAQTIKKDPSHSGAYATDATGGALQLAKEFVNKNDYSSLPITPPIIPEGEEGADGTAKYASLNTATIYMIADYTAYSYTHLSWNSTSSAIVETTTIEQYSNVAQISGEITLDLCGNTLSDAPNASSSSLFSGEMKTWGSTNPLFPAEVSIKNGEIVINSARPIVSYNAKSGADTKQITYNFDDVYFRVTKGNTTGSIIGNGTSKAADCSAFTNFTDCTFDISAAVNGASIFEYGNNKVNNIITIRGGAIITGNNSFVISKADGDPGRSVINFVKNDNGAYTTLTSTNAALNLTANDGKLTFKADSTDGTTTTYVLVPTASIGLNFTPKASVTLDSNLIFNIYLPEQDGVTIDKVTLDGKVITLGAANEGYYLVATPLAASESAEELKLVVTLTVDGTSLNGSFTFSTVKYAEKLLATPEITLTEKMLAKDMLAYVNSAYVYFNGESVDKIDTLLDGYVATNVIDPATAKQTTTGLNGAAFVLDSAPAIRFYFDEALANAITFKVGERALTADDILVADTDEIGYYVEFSLYAYEMTGVFSYTIAGSELSGEYNLVSYYNYAGSEDYANKYGTEKQAELVDLVAKFYSYCASAAAYRNN